jgi:hypothetical protein
VSFKDDDIYASANFIEPKGLIGTEKKSSGIRLFWKKSTCGGHDSIFAARPSTKKTMGKKDWVNEEKYRGGMKENCGFVPTESWMS